MIVTYTMPLPHARSLIRQIIMKSSKLCSLRKTIYKRPPFLPKTNDETDSWGCTEPKSVRGRRLSCFSLLSRTPVPGRPGTPRSSPRANERTPRRNSDALCSPLSGSRQRISSKPICCSILSTNRNPLSAALLSGRAKAFDGGTDGDNADPIVFLMMLR